MKSGISLKDDVLNRSDGILYVKVSDMNLLGNEKYIVCANSYANEGISSKMLFPVGTLLFPKRGGAIGTNKKRIASKVVCADLNIMGVIPSEKIRPLYLYYYFQNIDLGTLYNGSSVPQINNTDIAPMEIELFSLEKQDEIVGLLEKVDWIIRKRKEELSALDNLIKARFVEMFANWKKKYLAEPLGEYLQDITYGFTNPMPDAEEGPWKITAKDVVNGIVNLDTARKTSQESYDKLTEKSKPQLGDVLLTKDGTLGRTAVVEIGGMCVNQSVAVLRINKKILPKYLSILLQMPKYQRDMIADAGGGTIKHIYITKVVKMPIVVPSIEEQNTFLDFVHQVDKSKFKEKSCYIKYKILKIRHHQIYLLRK